MEAAQHEAQASAARQVATMLQKPNQLDKIDQYRRRELRKKAAVEARLKTAVQQQLDGVRTGLDQLHKALQDIKDMKQSLKEIDDIYKSCSHLSSKLAEVGDVAHEHNKFATAMENLKNIFNVPELIKKTQGLIEDGKLLQAHKLLSDLESSRDDLLFELHKQSSHSPTDHNLIKTYFSGVEQISESLGKQVWLAVSRTLTIVRKDPTLLVTALRILEREEMKDKKVELRRAQTGFLPPGRPKKWRNKCYAVLEKCVVTRIEGNIMEEREMEKMWLVRHLELIRKFTRDDLLAVKDVGVQCFPAAYQIYERFVKWYHQAISNHVTALAGDRELERNEIVVLLTWLNTYKSTELMGCRELEIDKRWLGELLAPDICDALQNKYLLSMKIDIQDWANRTLSTDIKEWYLDSLPHADGEGFYQTQIPVILFQIVEQNLQVASTISQLLQYKVYNMSAELLQIFTQSYRDAIYHYKARHTEERSEPRFYTQYTIGLVNNCDNFETFIQRLESRYTRNPVTAHMASKEQLEQFKKVNESFEMVASEGIQYLWEEVHMDLKDNLDKLLTRNWLGKPDDVDTICATLEDYTNDFIHLKEKYFIRLMRVAHESLAIEYINAMISRRITFKTVDERKESAEQIVKEATQIDRLLSKLSPVCAQLDSPTEAVVMMADVIKLRDPTMLQLEITGLLTKFPDVKVEHMLNMLNMREDMGRSEARIILEEIQFNDESKLRSDRLTIFSQLKPQ